jgi:hypothetical protein
MNLGWLDAIHLGLPGDGRAVIAFNWMDAIKPGWLSDGWR